MRDELLYSGITVPDKPTHTFLKSDWIRPEEPEDYPNLVVSKVPTTNGEQWSMDFLNTETGIFASEEIPVGINWPWVEHFHPAVEDWEGIGIPALT